MAPETSNFTYTLPEDFLSEPNPNIKKEVIAFDTTNIPEYKGHYACILDNVLTANECARLIRAAEAQTNGKWEQAMVNVGNNQQQLMTDYRACGRIIWDDRDVVAKIWARCQDLVPEIAVLKDKPVITGVGPVRKGHEYKLTRLNERMRFLSYTEGNYFKPHFDGSYATENNEEISFITLHLYLNEADQESQLEGGATTFHALDWGKRFMNVDPKVGRVLLFQHKYMLHSGADVTGGVKFTMRTDVMYKRCDEQDI